MGLDLKTSAKVGEDLEHPVSRFAGRFRSSFCVAEEPPHTPRVLVIGDEAHIEFFGRCSAASNTRVPSRPSRGTGGQARLLTQLSEWIQEIPFDSSEWAEVPEDFVPTTKEEHEAAAKVKLKKPSYYGL